jgi:rRNA-processing protein FCF1
MYDGLDEKLKKNGFDQVQNVKNLIREGKKLESDYSVLTSAKEKDMILITADGENKNECDENGFKCICINQTTVL